MINLQSAKTVVFTKMIYTYNVTYISNEDRSIRTEEVTTDLAPQKCRTAIKNALNAVYIVDVKLASKGHRKFKLPFDMTDEIMATENHIED